MTQHQSLYPFPGGVVQAQAAENIPGLAGALLGMVVEVANARIIQGEAGGLAHIVEQGGQPQGGPGRDSLQSFDTVGVYVEAVVGAVLVKAHGGGELGDHLAHGFGILQ